MARMGLHESANALLERLNEAAADHRFIGKLRDAADAAGLSSVRSAEVVRLLEDTGRIRVEQRGRRGRDTIIQIISDDRLTETDLAGMPRSGHKRRSISYEDIGRAVVDRLIELGRDDALRSAQVEAFAAENAQHRARLQQLSESLEQAAERETDLRIKLKAAQEALERSEDNLRAALNSTKSGRDTGATVDDEDTKALLDILRYGRQ